MSESLLRQAFCGLPPDLWKLMQLLPIGFQEDVFVVYLRDILNRNSDLSSEHHPLSPNQVGRPGSLWINDHIMDIAQGAINAEEGLATHLIGVP